MVLLYVFFQIEKKIKFSRCSKRQCYDIISIDDVKAGSFYKWKNYASEPLVVLNLN